MGYPNPTRYPVFHSIPDPTRFSFENHRVTGNPKYRVLPDILGKPGVSGITRYLYTRIYPTYPEIPENTRHTRKYPRVKKIPGNTRSYISTLLPAPTRPATRYFVQYPRRPDPILKKPYPLGPGDKSYTNLF